jgi:hypothetical protein
MGKVRQRCFRAAELRNKNQPPFLRAVGS